jgi:hypothetical protein
MGKDDKEFRLEIKKAERKADEITGEMKRQKKNCVGKKWGKKRDLMKKIY